MQTNHVSFFYFINKIVIFFLSYQGSGKLKFEEQIGKFEKKWKVEKKWKLQRNVMFREKWKVSKKLKKMKISKKKMKISKNENF